MHMHMNFKRPGLPLILLVLFASTGFSIDRSVVVGQNETTGKRGKGFDPSSILAAEGDVIGFRFQRGVHAVFESTFEQPCTPKKGGWRTDTVQPIPDQNYTKPSDYPAIRYRVNHSEPIWFFEPISGLCQQGAVFAVNPKPAQNMARFLENAKKDPGPSPNASPPIGLSKFGIPIVFILGLFLFHHN